MSKKRKKDKSEPCPRKKVPTEEQLTAEQRVVELAATVAAQVGYKRGHADGCAEMARTYPTIYHRLDGTNGDVRVWSGANALLYRVMDARAFNQFKELNQALGIQFIEHATN
jgi:hypothetical protein